MNGLQGARAGSHIGCGATRDMAMHGPSPSNADLAQVLRLVRDAVPHFCGAQCDAPRMADENEAVRVTTALTRYWRHAYPEAGAHYAALRCWGLAIWQPVYLSVIAAHAAPAVPRLSGITQPVVAGFPKGFRLPAHAPLVGDLPLRMRTAALEIHAYCDRMRAVLLPKVGLHRTAADRLQAECVLGALLLAGRHNPALCDDALIVHGQTWLALLDLVGSCDFFAYRARDGTGRLALDRQICCHHFRRRDGEKCSTCPKLPLDTRIGLLQAQLA